MQFIPHLTKSNFVLAPATSLYTYLCDYDLKWANLCHKVEGVFTALNAGLALTEFVSLGILTGRITDPRQLFAMAFNIQTAPVTWGSTLYGLSIIPLAALSGGIVHLLINRKSAKETELEARFNSKIADAARETQTIELDHRPSQNIDQAIYVARIILSISMIVFTSQTPVLYALNVVCLSYSLYKLSQQKWIKFTQKIPADNPDVQRVSREARQDITQVRAEYYLPLIVDRRIKEKGQDEGPSCAICLDETDPRIYFCAHQSYHVNCIADHFFRTCPNILRGIRTDRIVGQDRSGEETVTYPSSIPQDNLTSCPDCRQAPMLGHKLYFWITERDGRFDRGSGLVTLRAANAPA